MKKIKLKNKYPITGFVEINKQLIKDQIDSRTSRMEEIEKIDIKYKELLDEVKFHTKAIKELEEMKKEINN